jgi:hypothetical protein
MKTFSIENRILKYVFFKILVLPLFEKCLKNNLYIQR